MTHETDPLQECVRALRWFSTCSHTGLASDVAARLQEIKTAIQTFLAQYEEHCRVLSQLERERLGLLHSGATLLQMTENTDFHFGAAVTRSTSSVPISGAPQSGLVTLADAEPAVQRRVLGNKIAVHFLAAPVTEASADTSMVSIERSNQFLGQVPAPLAAPVVPVVEDNLTIEQCVIQFLRQCPDYRAADYELIRHVVQSGGHKRRARRTTRKVRITSVKKRLREMLGENKLVIGLENGRIVYQLSEGLRN